MRQVKIIKYYTEKKKRWKYENVYQQDNLTQNLLEL